MTFVVSFYIPYVAAAKENLAVPTPVVLAATTPVLDTRLVKDEFEPVDP
jgi:hypothetical protein